MPDISKITLPSGTVYDIKDAVARAQIEALTGGDAVVFIGVSSVALTEGGNETPVVGGESKTPASGQLFFYGTQQFIYGQDNKWHGLGDLSSLGSLAYQNDASATYTPAGTINTPTFTGTEVTVTITASDNANGNYTPKGSIAGGVFSGASSTFTGTFTPEGTISTVAATTTNKTATVSAASSGTATYTPAGTVSTPTISVATAGTTTTIKNPTSVTVAKALAAAAPGTTAPANAITYYSVANETLNLYQIGYTTGESITTDEVTVKTGDASYAASQPTFSGTGARLVTGNIVVPDTYTSTFVGTQGDISTTGVPNGSNSAMTFNGTKAQISGTTTAEGTIGNLSFTGTQDTITVS